MMNRLKQNIQKNKFQVHFLGLYRTLFICLTFSFALSSNFSVEAQVTTTGGVTTVTPSTVQTTSTQTDVEKAKTECAKINKTWNYNLNRCMTTQENYDLREEHFECRDSADPEACYDKIAQEKTGVKKGDHGKEDKISTIGASVSTAYAAFLVFAGKGAKSAGGKSMCMSKMVFMGSSVAWLGGDLYLKYSAKEKFKELAKKYAKESENKESKGAESSSFESQIRAFQYLKEEQTIVESNAKNRFMLHLAAAVGFGGSLALGIYESYMMGTPGGQTIACMKPEPGGGAKSMSLGSSPQIAIGAAVMLGLNGYLAMNAKKEEKKAKENIEEIDSIMASFKDSTAGFCPDGRDDLENARCYCYGSDGQKNPNRTKSQICTDLWAQDDKSFHTLAGDYGVPSGTPAKGCMTVTGQYDQDCRCKKMINTVTKKNACYKTVSGSASLSGIGSTIGIPATAGVLDSITNGANTGIANLSPASLQKSAARNNKLIEALLRKSKKKGVNFGPLLKNSEKLALRAAPALAKKAPKNTNFKSAFASSLAQSSRPNSEELNASLQKVEEQAKAGVAGTKTSGGGGLAALKRSGKKKNNFNFNWADNNKANTKVESFEETKEDYKYDANDIVKRDDVTIWQVISNRYSTSGLRRLFDRKE